MGLASRFDLMAGRYPDRRYVIGARESYTYAQVRDWSLRLARGLYALGVRPGESVAMVIDNRPGSSGISGTEMVARAAPDGYTLMVVASSFSINPALGRKLPYDALEDFTTVSQLSKFPNLLAAHPSFAPKTLPEVIAAAKACKGL